MKAIWWRVLNGVDRVRNVSLASWRLLSPLPWRERLALWWKCGWPGCCCPWCCAYCRNDYINPEGE